MQEFYSKLAGVTFSNKGVNAENRQRIIRDLALEGELKPGTELVIKRMPENPYDSDSVAVFAPDGRQLGFLPNRKENPVATTVSRNLQEGYRYRVFLDRVTGGLAGAVYGVNIKIQVAPPISQSSDSTIFPRNTPIKFTAKEYEYCKKHGKYEACKRCEDRYDCEEYLAKRFAELLNLQEEDDSTSQGSDRGIIRSNKKINAAGFSSCNEDEDDTDTDDDSRDEHLDRSVIHLSDEFNVDDFDSCDYESYFSDPEYYYDPERYF